MSLFLDSREYVPWNSFVILDKINVIFLFKCVSILSDFSKQIKCFLKSLCQGPQRASKYVSRESN